MNSLIPRASFLTVVAALACSSGGLVPGDGAVDGVGATGGTIDDGGTVGTGGTFSGGTSGSSGGASGGLTSGGSGGGPSGSGGVSEGDGGQASGGVGAASGSGGSGDGEVDPAFDTSIDSSTLTFAWANATNYTSYPDPGSDECVIYNGCEWAGYFAAVDGQQTEEWVEAHNIVAMFSAGDDNAAFDTYQLKRLRLRKNGEEMDVRVYDTCGDSDCDGCCTQNATQNGYSTLIDLESYTYARFGQGDGPIEWACLDCD